MRPLPNIVTVGQLAAAILIYASLASSLLLLFLFVFLWFIGFITPAQSAEIPTCPPPSKTCKLLTLTPDEERALIDPNQILHTAEQGRFLDLTNTVRYFRDKIRQAPVITVEEPVTPPQEPAAQPPK